MQKAENDNYPPPPLAPIIGHVGADGRVTITDPSWSPTPRAEVVPFPNDPREA